MSYAGKTTVPVVKSRLEIEALVTKHGATHFASARTPELARIEFVIHDRRLRFLVPLPTIDHAIAILKRRRGAPRFGNELQRAAAGVVESEDRRRWRCLLLAIKAKLESVASGIETFDEAFLAHIVTRDGRTMMQRLHGSQMLELGPGGAEDEGARTIEVG